MSCHEGVRIFFFISFHGKMSGQVAALTDMKVKRKIKIQDDPDSFFKSLRILLVFARFCGILPLIGILSSHHKYVEFTWKNIIHVYGLIILVVTCFFDYTYTADQFSSGFALDSIAPTVFYSLCLWHTFLLLEVARKWKNICSDFAQLDECLLGYGKPKKIATRINILVGSFILFAAVEHGTMTALNLRSSLKMARKGMCSFWECFYTIQFPAAGNHIPYSAYSAMFLFWVNAACTFNWNYPDFFLMGVGLVLSSRVALINDSLSSPGDKDCSEYWKNISTNYNRISCLVKEMDKILSKIIITSYLNNFYHLSLQLIRSLQIKGSIYQKIYFYFSLIYLMARMLVVSLCLAKVHDEGKKPADNIHTCTHFYIGTKRFLHQVVTDDVALTGARFFVISRGFIVKIITTIVTYEVMLLQFNTLQNGAQEE